jgi:hypothetical protein
MMRLPQKTRDRLCLANSALKARAPVKKVQKALATCDAASDHHESASEDRDRQRQLSVRQERYRERSERRYNEPEPHHPGE